jgi:hypothetical protein
LFKIDRRDSLTLEGGSSIRTLRMYCSINLQLCHCSNHLFIDKHCMNTIPYITYRYIECLFRGNEQAYGGPTTIGVLSRTTETRPKSLFERYAGRTSGRRNGYSQLIIAAAVCCCCYPPSTFSSHLISIPFSHLSLYPRYSLQ